MTSMQERDLAAMKAIREGGLALECSAWNDKDGTSGYGWRVKVDNPDFEALANYTNPTLALAATALREQAGMIKASDAMQSQQLEHWREKLHIPDSIQVSSDLVDDLCEHAYGLQQQLAAANERAEKLQWENDILRKPEPLAQTTTVTNDFPQFPVETTTASPLPTTQNFTAALSQGGQDES